MKVIFDVSMVAFYGIVYVKMREGRVLSRMMLWHGLFYGLLGLALCLPWIGMFLALFTPVGVLYLGMLWTPLGYYGALGVAAHIYCFQHLLGMGWANKRNQEGVQSAFQLSNRGTELICLRLCPRMAHRS